MRLVTTSSSSSSPSLSLYSSLHSMDQMRRFFLVVLVLLLTVAPHEVSSFNLLSFGRRSQAAMVLSNMEEPVAEVAEAINGETYLAAIDGEDVTTITTTNTNTKNGEEDNDETDLLNKRVPVTVRYSAESGLKPYFLTVAKRIKETHPDVILDRVIVPKETTEGGDKTENPTFEVVVDGKVIVRGPGRASGRKSSTLSIFVNCDELDQAISRARRRRRPATVYGEDGNVRLEILRTKSHSHHPHSRD